MNLVNLLNLNLQFNQIDKIEKENVEETPNNLSKSYLDSLRLSPEQPVKRKARKNYQFVKAFDSLSELDAYVTMSTKSGYKIEKNNRPVKCSLCCNSDNHKMEQQYWVCLCGVPSCDLAWKVNKCSNSETWYLAQNGQLHPDDWVYVRHPGQKKKKRYGIAINVQNIYNR